jgi:hypothetical protein
MKPTLTQILDAILIVNKVDKSYFMANMRSRLQKIQTIKQVFCLISRDYGYTLCQIGEFMKFDHSTILHNSIKAKQFSEFEPKYAKMVSKVSSILRDLLMCNETQKKSLCSDCEAFKNYQEKEKMFALGFFCPIKQKFILRDDIACEWIVNDNLPF